MAKTAQAVIETKVKDSASAGFRKVDKAMQNTAKQGKVLNQQFRFMRGGLGQVGHQVQDVAVQLQMGQNAMLVFGQQGSQIASLFGPGGALLGAILAVGAALSMALAPKFFGATQAAKDLKEEMKGLSNNFDTLTTAQKSVVTKEFTKKIDDNNEIISKNNEKLELLKRKLKEVNAANSKSAEAQAKQNQQTEKYIGIAPELIRVNQEAKVGADNLQESIDLLQAEVDTANAKNVEYQKTIDNTTTAFEKQRDALDKQIDTFGKSGHALRLLGIEADLQAKNITRTEADKLIARSETLNQLELDAAREKEIINEVAEEQKKAAKAAEDAHKSKEKAARKFADGFARSFTNALTTAETFKDGMKAVAKSVVDSLIQMIIQKQIADAIFNMIPASLGGGASSSAIKVQPGMTDFSSGVPVEFIGNGGGFTGHGSRSGGVDGKGGFGAILHPNETVIDHTKGQGMGVVVNQTINITTGVQQTVRAEIANLMPQISEATKAAVADSKIRGGNYSRALGA